MLQKFLKSIIIFSSLLTLLFSSCSSNEKKESETAEAAFAKAKEYEKDESYLQAIDKYNEVKNKFPYSNLAVQAELAIADIRFKEESWPEAQAMYQLFKELHPKHPNIPFVTHRLGLSYFNQLPTTIDRDLGVATQAITTFDEVIARFPNSEYIQEAREKKLSAQKMLAEKEIYIADFYFKKGQWLSALGRYEGVLAKHSGYGFDEKALARSVICSQKSKDEKKAKTLLEKLKTSFPNSREIQDTEKELQ
jgi:outer membrane protein assembly factor BamD